MSSAPQTTTLYDIIGVEPTATQDQIKAAYRRRAFELHPDHNRDDPNATEKFQQLSEAYSILKDPSRREKYDKWGIEGESPTAPEDIEIFEMMTQILGLGRSRGPPTGDQVSPSVRLFRVSLKEAYFGGKVSNRISIHQVCDACYGKGSTDGVEYPMCDQCHGAGSLSPGGLQFLFPCKNCRNVGYIMPQDKVCPKCKGHKVVSAYKTVEVEIPVGVAEMEHFLLPKEGDEYPGKISADLVLIVVMRWDWDLVRDNDDLVFVKKLSRIEAWKGTSFAIHHPSGRKFQVYTPAGEAIDFARIKWIEGMGMPVRANPTMKGNLYIQFRYGFPEPITESVRTISSLIHRISADWLLEDAPEAIQEEFQRREAEEIERQKEAANKDK